MSKSYSQAVRAAGLVFVSGTGPHDPVTGKIVPGLETRLGPLPSAHVIPRQIGGPLPTSRVFYDC